MKKFTKEMDVLLLQAAEHNYNAKKRIVNWKTVKEEYPIFHNLPISSLHQRYYRVLHPNLKRDEWTLEEDLLLFRAVERHGPKWSRIAAEEFFHTRCDVWIRSRYAKLAAKRKRKLYALAKSTLVDDKEAPSSEEPVCKKIKLMNQEEDEEDHTNFEDTNHSDENTHDDAEASKCTEPQLPNSPVKLEQDEGTLLEQFLGELVYQNVFDA